MLAVRFLRVLFYTAWILALGGCSKLGAEGLQRLRTLQLFEREPCRLLGVESNSRVTILQRDSFISYLLTFYHGMLLVRLGQILLSRL